MRLKVVAGRWPLPDEELSRIEDALNLAAERGKKYVPFGDEVNQLDGEIPLLDQDFDDMGSPSIMAPSKSWNKAPMVNVEDWENQAEPS